MSSSSNSPSSLPTALLSWLRAILPASPPTSLSSLQDGHLLWTVLHDIDPAYFDASTLPSSPSETAHAWIPRWQNLKHIEREVGGYVRDVCGVESGVGAEVSEGGAASARRADLKRIAQEGDEGQLVVLLRGILRAAMYSPESNERMGRVVVGLGKEVAGTIAAAMAAMEEAAEEVGEASGDIEGNGDVFGLEMGGKSNGRGSDKERDMELEHEEQLIQAHRIVRQLEESNAKAAVELEDLRRDKAAVEQALEKLKEDSTGGMKRGENEVLRELKDRSDEDRDYIAQLESELEAAKTTTASQVRQLERLKATGEANQRMKDDLQLVRAERDDLLSKTRANENLRKKIQNLQDESKGAATIREDLKNAQEQLLEMERWKDRCERLETTNRENMNIIANTEQEIFDMRTTRKRLEHEMRVLTQRYDVVRERQARDQEVIQELESKLAVMEDSGAEPGCKKGLDSEMDNADRPQRPVSRKASVAVPGGGDIALLEERLRTLGLRNKTLEEQYLDILSDKLGLETTLGDLNEGTIGNQEEKVPYLEQRKKLVSATEEVRKLQESVYELTSELATTKERLMTMQEDAKGGLRSPTSDDASKRLDSGAEYAALSRSYGHLTKHSETVQAELAESRALLRYALLSARGIGMEDEELRRSREWELVQQLLEEVRRSESDDVVEDVGKRVVARVESARGDGSSTQEDIRRKDAELESLRKQLEETQVAHKKEVEVIMEQAAKNGTGMTKGDEKAFAQLKRENQLMTSAWYDLSSRIQRDNVMIGRRRESPKSWLGKQRQTIGLGVSGVGR